MDCRSRDIPSPPRKRAVRGETREFSDVSEEDAMKLAAILGAAATLVLSASASAEISGDVVKIGVLNDMSGLYADIGGAGSVEAARMAIADFGGSVSGKKIELISGDHQKQPEGGSGDAPP